MVFSVCIFAHYTSSTLLWCWSNVSFVLQDQYSKMGFNQRVLLPTDDHTISCLVMDLTQFSGQLKQWSWNPRTQGGGFARTLEELRFQTCISNGVATTVPTKNVHTLCCIQMFLASLSILNVDTPTRVQYSSGRRKMFRVKGLLDWEEWLLQSGDLSQGLLGKLRYNIIAIH